MNKGKWQVRLPRLVHAVGLFVQTCELRHAGDTVSRLAPKGADAARDLKQCSRCRSRSHDCSLLK